MVVMATSLEWRPNAFMTRMSVRAMIAERIRRKQSKYDSQGTYGEASCLRLQFKLASIKAVII